MTTLAIRCHPGPHSSATELGIWLADEVERLRAATPRTTTRLSRLTDSLESDDDHAGWLIELGLPDAQTPVGWGRLVGVLRDMRLLGMCPTVLTVATSLEPRQAGTGEPPIPLSTGSDDGLAA